MMEENVLISTLTTMRLGGVVKYVQNIMDVKQIGEAYEFAKSKNLPVYVLGTGANVIGRDSGFDGLILVNKLKGIEILSDDGKEMTFRAMGGEILDDVVKFTTDKRYSGMEALSAIPGTMGAAPVQNVGAYGQEIKDVLVLVEAWDTLNARSVQISAAECQLSYRHSIFNSTEKGRYFVVSATMRVKKGELKPPFYISLQNYVEANKVTDFSPANIRRIITEIRAQKLPNPAVEASAGSFFKNVILTDEEAEEAKEKGVQVWKENNQNVVPSGWLIEQAGLKGQEFYGMKVSDKAALILINENATNYADLAKARQKIVDAVRERFGFTLEQEPEELT